jgi:hypothetical protein
MANPSYPNGLHHVQSGYFHLVKDENDDTWATTGNEESALAVVWIEDTDAGLGDLDTAWLGLSSGAKSNIESNHPALFAAITYCRTRKIRGGTEG